LNQLEKKQMGLRIKRSREEKGFTQDDLAEKLKMKNRASISSYEAGRSIPPSDVLRDLADILEVSADYLLGRGLANDLFNGEPSLGNEIGWAIKEERLSHGMTQQDLAKSIGVSQRDISQFERDIVPVPNALSEKIAEIFGMSLPKFLLKYDLYDGDINLQFDGDVDKHIAFKKAEEEDAMQDPGYGIQTIAAHHDGDKWTEDEIETIRKFKEFVKSQRKQ